MEDKLFEGMEYIVANEFMGLLSPKFEGRFNPSLSRCFVLDAHNQGFVSVEIEGGLHKFGVKKGDSLDLVLDELFQIQKINTVGPQSRVLWKRKEDLLF